ncbi:putative metalloprotease CJM1_0395 family protein [Halomonas sp. NO4]|uniref:putative metalloprotease CJM1_0395 family protein n=1 Tax=Halomonas sp. NO4 TaxID=2484813 RepID=UPI0013D00E66|nr:putative metalloprotease CJM1_0395 family protein [Halomonas sp. NO4]
MPASTVIGPLTFSSAWQNHHTNLGNAEAARQVGEPQAGEQSGDTQGVAAEEASQGKVSRGNGAEKPNGEALSEAELRQLDQLKQTDQEVRRHELAHQIAGGPYTSGASYEYERGPDGQRYAVAGEVPIDYGPVSGDPRATIDKMQQVISAALAPADPSPKDHQVAATARQYLLTAQLELAQQQSEMNSARQAGESSIEAKAGDTAETPSLSRYDIVTRTAQASGGDALEG